MLLFFVVAALLVIKSEIGLLNLLNTD